MEETTNNVGDASYLFTRKTRVNDEAQRRFTEKKWVWVPSKREAYASGFVVKEEGDECEVDCGGVMVKTKSCRVFKMNPPKFDMAEDLAELSYLNEPGVLYNLKRRYQNGLIYTYSGLFLLAINPYRDLRIYGEKDVRRYTLNKKYELEPHIFAVANEAYNSMLSNRENQSILITGESGAGKTENTKRVVEFLAMVAGYRNAGVNIDRQIIDANPILEAFGNAQTVKNDNSSRFGKFIKIKFNGGNICGAHIEKYLLEKSRVTRQNKDERNYHIFYQILSCDDTGLKKQLYLDGGPKDYRFLRNSRFKIQDVDDAKEFRRLRESMSMLSITEEEQMTYFKIVSAILHLGNIEFGEKDGTAEITNIGVAEKVCKLLSISVAEFIKCLVHPVIKAGNEYVAHNRSKEQVLRIVEALARILYDKMFDNVIERLNNSLSSSHRGNFIGVLDIAGFEIFKQNSFEQFCINYTNEKLQQFFNHHMFILEQDVYRRENIDWDFIDFGLDLQPTIDLIEKNNPIGILSYLDEECVMPMATEKTFLGKLVANIKSDKFEASKLKDAFTLNHYAGNVEYVVEDWLSKNKDPHSEALTSLIQTSDDQSISRLSLSEMSIKKGFFRTVGQKHKEQLASLMEQLCATNPHFVRCIIPNLEKSGEYLNSFLVLDQLKCNGVLEGIRISRQGFPSRMRYQEFVMRYRILAKDYGTMDNESLANVCGDVFKEAAERILKEVSVASNQYRLGQTKVFFRQGILADIEDIRDNRISEVMKEIQVLIRKRLASRKYNLTQKRMQSIAVIQRNARICCELQRWNWWKLYLKIKPLLDVGKRDNEMKEKDATIQAYMRSLEDEKNYCSKLEKRLKAIGLAKEALEKEVENEKRFSMEKDDLLMALRYKNDDVIRSLEASREEASALRMIVDDKEAKLDMAMDEMSRKDEELCGLRKALEEQKEVICEHEAKLKDMHGQLVSKSTENKAQIEALLQENASEIQKLKDKIRERDATIGRLEEMMRRLEECRDEKDKKLEEQEAIIEELNATCNDLRKWKDECGVLRSSYDSMQRKLRDEIGDVQLENDKLTEGLKKMSKAYEESESALKKLRDDLGFERSRGDKLEKAFQVLKADFGEMESQLQKERQFKDSTQESLLEKIRGLEKKLKHVSDGLKAEEALNKQLIAEKDEMYREIHLLQKSKLDEIFEREASFNSARKSLQMEIQKLELENQRLSREMAEMKAASETSEESISATEKFYVMLEEEKRKRKEIEHLVSKHEARNVVLATELESLKDMLEIERKAKEDMIKDQEKDISMGKVIAGVRKEIENVLSEMDAVVEGFNTTYLGILDGYKESLRECQEALAERESSVEKLSSRLEEMRSEVQDASSASADATEKNLELLKKYNTLLNNIESLTVKYNALEMVVAEKEEEIKRYIELSDESAKAFNDLFDRMDQEISHLHQSDDERKRYVEELKGSLSQNAMNMIKMEESYKAYAENSIKHVLDAERQRFRSLEHSYNQLTKKFNDLQEEHQSLIAEKMSNALRLEQLEKEVSMFKESESCARNQAAMYESEISALRRCARFKEEVVACMSKDRSPAVVHVSDKERCQALERKRLITEHELQKVNNERQAQVMLIKQLKDEVDLRKREAGEYKSQLFEMKKSFGCQSLLVARLTRELNEEKEMVKFLKPLTISRRKKN